MIPSNQVFDDYGIKSASRKWWVVKNTMFMLPERQRHSFPSHGANVPDLESKK